MISQREPCALSNLQDLRPGARRPENLLQAWPTVLDKLRDARHILLMTDYDGTLTPIVERPESALIPHLVQGILQELASQKRVTVGIISGRALSDLKKMVGVDGAIYAGNHGFEIEAPVSVS
jgi:trehalose 6-phosphate phosphatase